MKDLNGVDPTYMQFAQRVLFSGVALTLLELSPATVFFTASESAVGYLTTGMFLDSWYAESSGTNLRVVRGVLSLLDPEREPSWDTQLGLRLPRIRGAGLEYQVSAVAGEMPATAGACVLFINPATIPLTPRLTAMTTGV